MIKHHLSFASINLLSDNIAEVIADPNIDISLEMSIEYDEFLTKIFSSNFALLINKVNQYRLSFEAKLSMASHQNLSAIAVVTYDEVSKKSVSDVASMRALDGWNLKVFDSLPLGRQDALNWLQSELNRPQ